MAQIPDQSGVPQVSATPTAPNDYQNIRSSPEDFGAAVAQGTQKLGQGVSQAGGDMTDVLVQRQNRQNEIGVDDMMQNLQNQVLYKTFGGDPANPTAQGLYQLHGKAAMDAGPGVANGINDLRNNISKNLNPAQKLLFDERSNRLVQYTQGEIGRHLDAEQDRYGTDSNTATMDVQTKSASLQYNSDQAINNAIDLGKQALFRNVQIKGDHGDPDIVSHALTTATTNVVRGSIEGALANKDPMRASHIMDTWGSQMDPQARLQLSHQIQASVDEFGVAGIVQQATSKSSYPVATQQQTDEGQGHNDTFNRMLHLEGGVNPDGSARTSSAGAVGKGQIMSATYAQVAQAHNIPYDPVTMRTDQALNQTLGRLYFGDMLKRYNGNDTLAAAAYNAGPGNVDQWLKSNGDPRTGAISDRAWANSIPLAETRNYALNAAQPQSKFVSQEQALVDARNMAQQQRPNDPVFAEKAERGVYEHYAMTDALEAKQQADQQKATQAQRESVSDSIVTAVQTDLQHFNPTASISHNDALSSQEKIHLWDWYHAEVNRQQNGGGEHGYGPGYDELYKRIMAPEGTPNRITDQSQLWPNLANGDLNAHGHQSLTGILQSRKSPDGEAEQQAKKSVFDGIKAHVESPMFPGEKSDDRSHALWGQATVALENAYKEGKAKGLTYKDMLDEKSPNYIGAVAKPFIRTTAQKLKDQADALVADTEQPGQPLPAAQADTPAPAPRFTPEQIHAEMQRRGLLKPAQPAAPTGPQVPTN